MFCPHCGTPSVAGSGYCSACGKSLAGATATVTGVLTPPSVDAPTAVGPPSVPGITGLMDASPQENAETTAIRQMIGDRYQIIRLLGVGGMGAVYQAWDEKLAIAVALKVIRQPVDQDARAFEELRRRFKRELLLARQVTHKNVVRIHDLVDRGQHRRPPVVAAAAGDVGDVAHSGRAPQRAARARDSGRAV